MVLYFDNIKVKVLPTVSNPYTYKQMIVTHRNVPIIDCLTLNLLGILLIFIGV